MADSLDEKQRKINLWYSLAASFYDIAMMADDPKGARQDLIEKLGITQNSRVIEISVGTGRNIQYYPGFGSYYCIDINKGMLNVAKRKITKHRKKVSLAISDAKHLPFAGNIFDVGILTYALSGSPYNQNIFQKAIHVIKPYGKLAILDFREMKESFLGGCSDMDLEKLLEAYRSKARVISRVNYAGGFFNPAQRSYVLEKVSL